MNRDKMQGGNLNETKIYSYLFKYFSAICIEINKSTDDFFSDTTCLVIDFKNVSLTDSLFWLNYGVGCRFAIDSIRMVLDLMFLLQRRWWLLLVLDFFGVSHWCCYEDSIKRVMFKKKMVKRITLAQTIVWPLSFPDVSLLRTASNWSAQRSLQIRVAYIFELDCVRACMCVSVVQIVQH